MIHFLLEIAFSLLAALVGFGLVGMAILFWVAAECLRGRRS